MKKLHTEAANIITDLSDISGPGWVDKELKCLNLWQLKM